MSARTFAQLIFIACQQPNSHCGSNFLQEIKKGSLARFFAMMIIIMTTMTHRFIENFTIKMVWGVRDKKNKPSSVVCGKIKKRTGRFCRNCRIYLIVRSTSISHSFFLSLSFLLVLWYNSNKWLFFSLFLSCLLSSGLISCCCLIKLQVMFL